MKEGFVFAGWKLADGTAFDFDAVLTDSVQLFASWQAKPAETDSESSQNTVSGCGSGLCISAGLTAIFVAGAALAIKKSKEND